MRTIRMLARCDVRRRWRSTVALALLLGAVGGIVLATVAGARRSDSSLARFNSSSHSADVEISVGTPTASQLRTFRRSPGVEAVAVVRAYALIIGGDDGTAVAVPVGPGLGTVVDRPRLVRGRFPNPSAPDEATIGEGLAAKLHLHAGSHLDAASFTPAQIYVGFHGGNPGGPAGPHVRFQVVGIVRLPLDLGERAASGGVVTLTPAFIAEYASRVGRYTDSVWVKTVAGRPDVARVVATARKLWGTATTFQVQPLGIETEGAHNAIDVLTSALWIIAGVAALAGGVAIAIVLARDMTFMTVDQSTLRGLGVTRAQRTAAGGARAGLIAGAGALLALLGAILASPLFPIGVARRADPDVGVHADWLVLGLGVALLAVIVLGLAIIAAWRSTRVAVPDALARARRNSSPVVETAARAGLPPPATNGLRMALQAGRGASSVPVRSAFAGAVFAVAGITAALVFAASLAHLVATPRLSGATFDLKTEVGDHQGSTCLDNDDHGLARVPGVAAIAAACVRSIQVDGHPVSAWAFATLRGTIDPEIVAGRAPAGAGEVALGSVTLRAIHKHIGETVSAHGEKGTRNFLIVGRVVLPSISTEDLQPLADGASFTIAGFRPLVREGENETHDLLVRVAPGADRDAVRQRVEAVPRSQNAGAPTTPVEISRLQQIDWVPAVLALLLAVLALVAVGHALVTSVRRHRRELALFKTIGFSRRQLRATVAWQATTVAAVGIAVGIPMGLVVGRVVWRLVADGLGVAPNPTIPLLSLALFVFATLALVNVIAFVPARTAAKTRPAVALRSE